MGINEEGLNEIKGKLNFVNKKPAKPAPVIGCGENHPASEAKPKKQIQLTDVLKYYFLMKLKNLN